MHPTPGILHPGNVQGKVDGAHVDKAITIDVRKKFRDIPAKQRQGTCQHAKAAEKHRQEINVNDYDIDRTLQNIVYESVS